MDIRSPIKIINCFMINVFIIANGPRLCRVCPIGGKGSWVWQTPGITIPGKELLSLRDSVGKTVLMCWKLGYRYRQGIGTPGYRLTLRLWNSKLQVLRFRLRLIAHRRCANRPIPINTPQRKSLHALCSRHCRPSGRYRIPDGRCHAATRPAWLGLALHQFVRRFTWVDHDGSSAVRGSSPG